MAKDQSLEAGFGRPHTAAIAAARTWGARVVGEAHRVQYCGAWAAAPGAGTSNGARCVALEIRVQHPATRTVDEPTLFAVGDGDRAC
eukprot:925409-Lingulodinium_polyedra.AAC.1